MRLDLQPVKPGPQILQLETYASDGTTSQVLQIDVERANELMAIIKQVFPGLQTDG